MSISLPTIVQKTGAGYRLLRGDAVVATVAPVPSGGWRVIPNSVGRRASRRAHSTAAAAIASMSYMTEGRARSAMIAATIDALPVEEGYAVIFNGREPRYLGRVGDDWKREADALLLANRLSATYVSLADVLGRPCVLAHS